MCRVCKPTPEHVPNRRIAILSKMRNGYPTPCAFPKTPTMLIPVPDRIYKIHIFYYLCKIHLPTKPASPLSSAADHRGHWAEMAWRTTDQPRQAPASCS